MPTYREIRRKLLLDHLEKYKDASTHCLTRILMRDYPEFFDKFESLRSLIRFYRGASGNRSRQGVKFRKYCKTTEQ